MVNEQKIPLSSLTSDEKCALSALALSEGYDTTDYTVVRIDGHAFTCTDAGEYDLTEDEWTVPDMQARFPDHGEHWLEDAELDKHLVEDHGWSSRRVSKGRQFSNTANESAHLSEHEKGISLA